jgi:hypothetical protein
LFIETANENHANRQEVLFGAPPVSPTLIKRNSSPEVVLEKTRAKKESSPAKIQVRKKKLFNLNQTPSPKVDSKKPIAQKFAPSVANVVKKTVPVEKPRNMQEEKEESREQFAERIIEQLEGVLASLKEREEKIRVKAASLLLSRSDDAHQICLEELKQIKNSVLKMEQDIAVQRVMLSSKAIEPIKVELTRESSVKIEAIENEPHEEIRTRQTLLERQEPIQKRHESQQSRQRSFENLSFDWKRVAILLTRPADEVSLQF